ncbi:MAG: SAF domain-containing protein [Bowdeniella nasicola]|nr:SAF domain-containing protein [Bowdeniella nasicola]
MTLFVPKWHRLTVLPTRRSHRRPRRRAPAASDTGRAAQHLRAVRLSLWRQRYLLGAVWVIALAWWVVAALAPPPTGTPAIVVTNVIQPGDRIQPADMTLEPIPARLRPADALSAQAAVGERTARIALQPGTVLTEAALTSGEFASQLPTGFVALPIVLQTEARTVTEVGQWVELYGTTPSGATLVAERALVLSVTTTDETELFSATGQPAFSAVVAIPSKRATVLLDALARAPLRAVLSARTGVETE